MSTNYIYGTGRRKTAVARVRLLPGDGSMVVNGKDAADYFGRGLALHTIRTPFRVTETEGRYSASVLVAGGGFTGQAGACCQGIARALKGMFGGSAEPQAGADGEETAAGGFAKKLRDSGFLTRDSRMKERKKYGQKGARKSFQFSKR